MKRVIIGGIGNVLMGDDGAGPYFSRILESRYEFEEGVEVRDFGTPGLDFVVHISCLDALIIVDAVDNGTAPGTISTYHKADILASPVPMRLDPHQPALKESIWVTEIDGKGPKEVVLIGISGQTYGFRNRLTDAVRAGVEDAIAAVLKELDALGVTYTRKTVTEDSNIWWEQGPAYELTIGQ